MIVTFFFQPASSTTSATSTVVTTGSGHQVLREVIVKPPAPRSQKNKSVACKPIMQHKGINVKPQPCHKAVQTGTDILKLAVKHVERKCKRL